MKKKGTTFLDAGYVWAPYVPLQVSHVAKMYPPERYDIEGEWHPNHLGLDQLSWFGGHMWIEGEVIRRFVKLDDKGSAISIFMPKFQPGDLVRLKLIEGKRSEKVQVYKVNDLEHFNRVLNDPERFVTISNTYISGLRIPPIDVTFSHVDPGQAGLYLGYMNVEDYGRLGLYYGVLLERSIYLVSETAICLEFGKRKIQVAK